MSMDKKFVFNGPRIVLDVGGVHYSTSRSTLTKYPESMLGVMFSGRHDLATMQCENGSFFIDRDGTHFRHILNYLRDGEEEVESFPKSADILLELVHESEFYQLDGLTSVLKPVLRESDVVIQDQITSLFFSGGGNYNTDYGGNNFSVSYYSKDKIRFKHKNMRGLSFNYIYTVKIWVLYQHLLGCPVACLKTAPQGCWKKCYHNSHLVFSHHRKGAQAASVVLP